MTVELKADTMVDLKAEKMADLKDSLLAGDSVGMTAVYWVDQSVEMMAIPMVDY